MTAFWPLVNRPINDTRGGGGKPRYTRSLFVFFLSPLLPFFLCYYRLCIMFFFEFSLIIIIIIITIFFSFFYISILIIPNIIIIIVIPLLLLLLFLSSLSSLFFNSFLLYVFEGVGVGGVIETSVHYPHFVLVKHFCSCSSFFVVLVLNRQRPTAGMPQRTKACLFSLIPSTISSLYLFLFLWCFLSKIYISKQKETCFRLIRIFL